MCSVSPASTGNGIENKMVLETSNLVTICTKERSSVNIHLFFIRSSQKVFPSARKLAFACFKTCIPWEKIM
jgi:hypothetical protein